MEERKVTGVHAKAEITASELPEGWPWAVFAGLEEVLRLFESRPVDVYSMHEGTVFRSHSRHGVPVPLLYVEGHYYDFAMYETPALGFLCHTSGVATRAARYRKMAGEAPIMAFGIRRAHPAIAPMIDRASFIGGCDSVSSIAGAEILGMKARGTMPHALILVFGDSRSAFRAYADALQADERRIALADTFSDEREETLAAIESIPDLYGVRLDTPRSRRGSFPQIISEIKWEMKVRGYEGKKIFVSGGIREDQIRDLLRAGADGFGIGTAISSAPAVDFSMDLVEVSSKSISKRGKFSGRKHVYRCPRCMQFDVLLEERKVHCPECGSEEEYMLSKYIEGGRRLLPEEHPGEIRERVLCELGKLPDL